MYYFCENYNCNMTLVVCELPGFGADYSTAARGLFCRVAISWISRLETSSPEQEPVTVAPKRGGSSRDIREPVSKQRAIDQQQTSVMDLARMSETCGAKMANAPPDRRVCNRSLTGVSH